MRWSRSFIPTLRQDPAEAEVPSHRLLLRGGYVRQLAAGVYSYLPLAQRVMLKIFRILREEFDRIGAQEFYLPALHPADIWIETGRWEDMGANMFRLKDRAGRDLCLGMTHEEVFTTIVRNEIRSYKDLPQIWYQIQVKFRDEPRPRAGLLRVRQFTMKDSYSFDVDQAGLDESYRRHHQAYCRVYERCGLTYTVVEAYSGAMGGRESHEFMVRTDAGEDRIATCECGYAANLEVARSALVPIADSASADGGPRRVHTPGQKTIAEVSRFLNVAPQHQIKSLVYMVESQPALILLRGDHQLNEAKLSLALSSGLFRPATEAEIRDLFGADAGSLGPVGIDRKMTILADEALRGRKNLTAGGNENDYHLQGVTPDLDFQANYSDLRLAEAGEPCTRCGRPLEVSYALEVGHIFKLGTKYSESMGAYVLNREGQQVPIVMGSYGIGLERIMAAAVELYHDPDGIFWPLSIAPFQVVVTPVSMADIRQREAAEKLYGDLIREGVEALLDDREERAGVKFKDADLIGVPFRITVGQKIGDGQVEIYHRAERRPDTVPLGECVPRLRRLLDASLARYA
ncbi:MAG: proline--tRNA ligase, partial [Acidobacteria bacterium]|nr:proline--tRNA ligase [Acidobacteriota bacterium]